MDRINWFGHDGELKCWSSDFAIIQFLRPASKGPAPRVPFILFKRPILTPAGRLPIVKWGEKCSNNHNSLQKERWNTWQDRLFSANYGVDFCNFWSLGNTCSPTLPFFNKKQFQCSTTASYCTTFVPLVSNTNSGRRSREGLFIFNEDSTTRYFIVSM